MTLRMCSDAQLRGMPRTRRLFTQDTCLTPGVFTTIADRNTLGERAIQ